MSTPAPGTLVPSIFQFDSQAVRIFVDEQGEPWFCATDVCTVLGYQNAPDAVTKHCRKAGIAKRDSKSSGQTRELTFINEGNLYRLIIKSHLPAAQRFEAWVCDEVLPAIRKTGRYETETPSQENAVRFHYSSARVNLELRPDHSGDIHFIGLTPSNAANMLLVAAHALLKVSSINCGEETAL